MTGWIETTLGELCDRGGGTIRTGPFGSQLHQKDYSDVGTPVVMPQDLLDGRVSERSIARVGPEHVRRLNQHQLKVTDIVYGRRGDIGRRALITEREAGWLCGTGCLRITPGSGQVNSRFLFYALGEPRTVEQIAKKAVGATMANLNTSILREVPLRLPTLPEQNRIASILGAYDDLIDVNRQRIVLLEEMSRRLFEEWFVRFCFPNHGDQIIIETSEGPLPQGWRRVRLDTIARVNADSIKPANAPAYIGYVDIASVTQGDIQKIEWQRFVDAPGRARRKVKDGSIIWSMVRPNRRSYALILNPDERLIVSTGFAVLDAFGISPSYLYHYVTTDAFVGYLVGNTTGAAYPAVTGATFERALVLLPPAQVDLRFSLTTEPMLRLANVLRWQNVRLAASRDLLLPRLISGEVCVTAAERELEPAE
jgi:type I restriction enzyme, S subunit